MAADHTLRLAGNLELMRAVFQGYQSTRLSMTVSNIDCCPTAAEIVIVGRNVGLLAAR